MSVSLGNLKILRKRGFLECGLRNFGETWMTMRMRMTMIPLLHSNVDMRSRRTRYIRYIVEHQQPNPIHLPLHSRYRALQSAT